MCLCMLVVCCWSCLSADDFVCLCCLLWFLLIDGVIWCCRCYDVSFVICFAGLSWFCLLIVADLLFDLIVDLLLLFAG